jgi:hypothetical protein
MNTVLPFSKFSQSHTFITFVVFIAPMCFELFFQTLLYDPFINLPSFALGITIKFEYSFILSL